MLTYLGSLQALTHMLVCTHIPQGLFLLVSANILGHPYGLVSTNFDVRSKAPTNMLVDTHMTACLSDER